MSTGMVPFVRFFPEQGTAETRVLTIRGHPILPDDEYALLESFCDDAGCDCRRVMLNVIARRQQAFKAIAKTNHFPAKLVRCQHYGAQNRVEPRTIATAGQSTNARFHFRRSEIRALSLDQPSDPQPPIDRTAASRVASGLRLLRIG